MLVGAFKQGVTEAADVQKHCDDECSAVNEKLQGLETEAWHQKQSSCS
jgi:hypothetical protein